MKGSKKEEIGVLTQSVQNSGNRIQETHQLIFQIEERLKALQSQPATKITSKGGYLIPELQSDDIYSSDHGNNYNDLAAQEGLYHTFQGENQQQQQYQQAIQGNQLVIEAPDAYEDSKNHTERLSKAVKPLEDCITPDNFKNSRGNSGFFFDQQQQHNIYQSTNDVPSTRKAGQIKSQKALETTSANKQQQQKSLSLQYEPQQQQQQQQEQQFLQSGNYVNTNEVIQDFQRSQLQEITNLEQVYRMKILQIEEEMNNLRAAFDRQIEKTIYFQNLYEQSQHQSPFGELVPGAGVNIVGGGGGGSSLSQVDFQEIERFKSGVYAEHQFKIAEINSKLLISEKQRLAANEDRDRFEKQYALVSEQNELLQNKYNRLLSLYNKLIDSDHKQPDSIGSNISAPGDLYFQENKSAIGAIHSKERNQLMKQASSHSLYQQSYLKQPLQSQYFSNQNSYLSQNQFDTRGCSSPTSSYLFDQYPRREDRSSPNFNYSTLKKPYVSVHHEKPQREEVPRTKNNQINQGLNMHSYQKRSESEVKLMKRNVLDIKNALEDNLLYQIPVQKETTSQSNIVTTESNGENKSLQVSSMQNKSTDKLVRTQKLDTKRTSNNNSINSRQNGRRK